MDWLREAFFGVCLVAQIVMAYPLRGPVVTISTQGVTDAWLKGRLVP